MKQTALPRKLIAYNRGAMTEPNLNAYAGRIFTNPKASRSCRAVMVDIRRDRCFVTGSTQARLHTPFDSAVPPAINRPRSSF